MDLKEVRPRIDVLQLRQMSYNDLRAFAKTFNIKGNIKASKLIDAILKKNNQHEVVDGCELSEEEVDNADQVLPQVSVKEDAAKTPGAISKMRRRTYELTPETTQVLDITKAKDIAITNPATVIKGASSKVVKAKAMKSKIPVKGNGMRRACPTPNFNKLHEREFEKMDSIDVYAAKRKARYESHRNAYQKSVKNIRTLGSKSNKPSPIAGGKIFEPTVKSTAAMNLAFSNHAQNKMADVQLPKPRAVKHIVFMHAKSPFRFVGAPAKSEKTLLPKSKPTMKEKARPTFRYQPPKQKGKDELDGGVRNGKQPFDKACTILKGVRLNKRFQLQLKARGLDIN